VRCARWSHNEDLAAAFNCDYFALETIFTTIKGKTRTKLLGCLSAIRQRNILRAPTALQVKRGTRVIRSTYHNTDKQYSSEIHPLPLSHKIVYTSSSHTSELSKRETETRENKFEDNPMNSASCENTPKTLIVHWLCRDEELI